LNEIKFNDENVNLIRRGIETIPKRIDFLEKAKRKLSV